MHPSAPSVHYQPAPGSRFLRVCALVAAGFGWLVCTLAAGVVAAFLAMVGGLHPSWLILLLAIPLTLALKVCGCLGSRGAWLVAALAVVLAGFYAVCLAAIGRIAAAVGFPFAQAFWDGGVYLTLLVARLGLSVISLVAFAVAVVLATTLTVRVTRATPRR